MKKSTLLKKYTLTLFILMVGCVSMLWSQTGGVVNVTSTGVGIIYANDVTLARDRAIDDALRKAVEQSLGMWLQSESIVENFMLVEDNILSWSSGYVKNYNIVSEMKKPDNVYEVTLNAAVEAGALSQDQDAVINLIEKAGNPRIAIIFNESNIGESYNQYHFFDVDMTQAETTLMDKFLQKNFEVVDPATVREGIKREQAIAALEGNDKMAAAIGLQLDADVVITGKAVAKVAATQMKVLGDMKSCQANLTARVVKADVGTVMATSSEHAAHPHIDEITGGNEAIKKAANKLGDDLIKKILAKWKNDFYNKTSVKLRITGLASMSDLADFKGILQNYFRGVKQIYQRNYVAGTAELDLQITGNANQLSRELERKPIEEFDIKITRLSLSQINLSIKKNQPKQNTVPDSTQP